MSVLFPLHKSVPVIAPFVTVEALAMGHPYRFEVRQCDNQDVMKTMLGMIVRCPHCGGDMPPFRVRKNKGKNTRMKIPRAAYGAVTCAQSSKEKGKCSKGNDAVLARQAMGEALLAHGAELVLTGAVYQEKFEDLVRTRGWTKIDIPQIMISFIHDEVLWRELYKYARKNWE